MDLTWPDRKEGELDLTCSSVRVLAEDLLFTQVLHSWGVHSHLDMLGVTGLCLLPLAVLLVLSCYTLSCSCPVLSCW